MDYGADTGTDRLYDYLDDVADAEYQGYLNYLEDTGATVTEYWREDEGYRAWVDEQMHAEMLADASIEDRYFDPWE